MKKILQNFYLFSKLSLSISLLLALFFLGYLFYRSYSLISVEESIELTNNNNLINSINSNSSRIEKIELLINENNLKLIDIINTLKSSNENKQSKQVLEDIEADFNDIKLELKKLQNSFQKNEIAKKQPDQLNNINKENTIKLIKFKFENGLDYSKELDLLSKILGVKSANLIEKLYLINNNRFVGNKILKSYFKKETDVFISNSLLSSNRIINIILPYIKIEPSKNKQLSDSRLIAIENISRELESKNYLKSINLINSIDKNTKFFKLTKDQLSIAADFNKTLGGFLDNG